MVLRSYLSVGSVSRSSQNSFEQSTKRVVQNMLKSFHKRMEVQLLYGQMGIGAVTSIAANVITITPAEWAAGIWSGAENMPIEIRTSAGALRGSATVESVDLANKTVTVDAAPAGVDSTDVIWYKGAYNKEFAGLHKIITNTGQLFNVDASQYSLFSGNSVAVGGNLTFAKIEEGIAKAMEKGLAEDDVIVLCSPLSWKNLLTEQAAKREYDSSYNNVKIEQGAKAICFYGPNGKIEIHSSIHVKEGYAYMMIPEEFERIGSSDITFEQPGFEGKFFKLLESANGYELRAYCDQALFTPAPGLATIFTGVTS